MTIDADTAQYALVRHNGAWKSDNNRIALSVRAMIANRIEDLCESDIGTQYDLFNIGKISDE
jgi:T-complex protein 1 subunit gamma